MPDYDYYVNCYLGNRVPEGDFPSLASQAKSVLAQFERQFQMVGGQEARMMAVCAMAEELYDRRRRDHILSSTVGSVTVHYQAETDSVRAMTRALYRKARIYLDFCRKVG